MRNTEEKLTPQTGVMWLAVALQHTRNWWWLCKLKDPGSVDRRAQCIWDRKLWLSTTTVMAVRPCTHILLRLQHPDVDVKVQYLTNDPSDVLLHMKLRDCKRHSSRVSKSLFFSLLCGQLNQTLNPRVFRETQLQSAHRSQNKHSLFVM